MRENRLWLNFATASTFSVLLSSPLPQCPSPRPSASPAQRTRATGNEPLVARQRGIRRLIDFADPALVGLGDMGAHIAFEVLRPEEGAVQQT